MRLIQEQGLYQDETGDIWRYTKHSKTPFKLQVILYRKSDSHAQLYNLNGKNIDTPKPSIVKYLDQTKYPEYYL